MYLSNQNVILNLFEDNFYIFLKMSIFVHFGISAVPSTMFGSSPLPPFINILYPRSHSGIVCYLTTSQRYTSKSSHAPSAVNLNYT